jgi:hypothetical protein
MTANIAVVYDACVVYPAPLRDLLVQLATTRSFSPTGNYPHFSCQMDGANS